MHGIMRVFFLPCSLLIPLTSGDLNDHDDFDFFHVSFSIFEKVMRR
jgi:hypothetical protein